METAIPTGGSSSSSSGMTRLVQDEGDDGHRGDLHIDSGGVAIDTVKCRHCRKKVLSMSMLFAHLYTVHDDDGEGAKTTRGKG